MMNERIQPRMWTLAAGSVTMSFGVLTACMAAALTIVMLVGGIREPVMSPAEVGLALLISTTFVLLGYGTLRSWRNCAGAALALAALLMGFQLAAFGKADGRSAASAFFLLLPTIVVAVNWMALQSIPSSRQSASRP